MRIYVGDIPESPLVFEQSWTKKLSEGQKLQIDYLLSDEGSTDTGIINIPLPGWYLDNRNMYRIAALDGRTLLYYADNVVTQWQELSPTEQKIEMALTATANAGAREANFDNIQSFDSALDWITHNKGLINIYADNARVPEEILRVILTSEILYDYGTLDAWQDAAVRQNIPLSIDIGWQATGVANVHYATLDVARIWGRYRSAYEPLDAAVFGPNAQLARPIAEYLLG